MKTEYEPDTQYTAAETSSSDLTPDQVYTKSNWFQLPPVDSAQARIYSDPLYEFKEAQAEFFAESFLNGNYIRNPAAMVQEHNRVFPKFPLHLGEPSLPSIAHYMSQLLASIDGPLNVIWNTNGSAAGYRLPGSNQSLLGDELYPWVRTHFCFLAIPEAWAQSDNIETGISLAWYYRILSHPFVGFISPDEAGDEWKPGPANRSKEDGVIHGSVDYVIRDPGNGKLYLTPHALAVLDDRLLDLAKLIF